jgi:hypothetical protein
LSQEKFGQLTGSCTTTISRWETGKWEPAGMSLVIIMAMHEAVVKNGESSVRGFDWNVMLENNIISCLAALFTLATHAMDE